MRADTHEVRPGEQVRVRVFVEGPLETLRSYQLDTVVTGGTSGALSLVDITIEPRKDAVFAETESSFDAFNVNMGRMLAGLDADSGVRVAERAYLATFVFSASQTAAGKFVIDLRTGEGGETYLVAPLDGEILIERTKPAIVSVSKRRLR